ncbi:MAG: sulfotransferase family 2 domain-containing protein [Litorimonas sp.]
MIISHKFRTVFIHVHRTGGTTIENLLSGSDRNAVIHSNQHANATGSAVKLLDKHGSYFAFGFVRNPWERLLSWYHLLNRGVSETPIDDTTRRKFHNFLTGLARRSQHDDSFHLNQLDYFTDQTGRLRVDRIGRFENFAEDLEGIFRTIGCEFSDPPIFNVTFPKAYQSYYSTEAKDLVANACRDDISRFGYRF